MQQAVLLLALAAFTLAMKPGDRTMCVETPNLATINIAQATPHRVELVNAERGVVTAFWVDSHGQEVRMQDIQPGSRTSFNSFQGHAWRLRDSSQKSVAEGILDNQDMEVKSGTCSSSAPVPELVSAEAKWGDFGQGGAITSLPWKNDNPLDNPKLASCTQDLLSSVASPGFHVICPQPLTSPPKGAKHRVAVYRDGVKTSQPSDDVLLPELNGVHELVEFMMWRLGLRRPGPDWAQPAIYTRDGVQIVADPDAVTHNTALLLFEGGVWIWPTPSVGHVRNVTGIIGEGRHVFLKTLAMQPKIFEVLNFIQDDEVAAILEHGGPKVSSSGVVVKDAHKGRDATEWRTSATHFLSSRNIPALEQLESRVQKLTRVPLSHAEDVQVLKYSLEGKYDFHHDFFDPKDYAQNAHWMQQLAGGTNRMVNTFMYLNDVEEGGETGFPRAGGLSQVTSFDASTCTRGLVSKPIKGKVVVFYMMHPDSSLDHHSLHGGCGVKKGVKWSGNFWQWNKPRSYGRTDFHREASRQLPVIRDIGMPGAPHIEL